MTGGEWGKALHYVPPLFAFVLGVIMASWLRKFAPDNAPEISVGTEIVFLFIIAILHNRLPVVAGTLGLSFVAAFQTASFPKVEGWGYSSVMATSNFRYTIEGLFAAFAGSSEARPFRRPYVFGAMCIAFGVGAAIGAVMTEVTRAYSLAIPVTCSSSCCCFAIRSNGRPGSDCRLACGGLDLNQNSVRASLTRFAQS